MLQIWAAPRALRTIGRGFENASGLGFWTSHPLHHAHMVNCQSHVRPEPCEARARRARAKNRMRKAGNHEPTASQMVFVGTRFSSRPGNAEPARACGARAFVRRYSDVVIKILNNNNLVPVLLRHEQNFLVQIPFKPTCPKTTGNQFVLRIPTINSSPFYL